jgi:hypothetical protein
LASICIPAEKLDLVGKMVDRDLFEPVTSGRIGEELGRNFSQGLLTLVSIVLGVALAVLAQRLSDCRDHWTLDIGIHALTCFLAITGTFYFYNYFMSVFTLQPNFIQVLLPFLLGTSIIGTAYTVGDMSYFWKANGLLYLVAACTFLNTIINNRNHLYDVSASKAYILIRNEEIKNVTCFALMGFGTLLFLSANSGPLLSQSNILLFVWNGTIYVVCIILTETMFLRGIYGLVKEGRKRDATATP